MGLPKQKQREIIFQLLYSHDLSEADPADVVPMMMAQLEVSRRNMREAHEKMLLVVNERDELDQLIGEAAKEYEFKRIQRVERNVLRLGVYEMLHDEGIPPKVAITEALRLTKKFSTPEAVSFVNAVLDAIYKSQFPEEKEESKMDTFFGKEEDQK